MSIVISIFEVIQKGHKIAYSYQKSIQKGYGFLKHDEKFKNVKFYKKFHNTYYMCHSPILAVLKDKIKSCKKPYWGRNLALEDSSC